MTRHLVVIIVITLAGCWPSLSTAETTKSLREVFKQVDPSVVVVETNSHREVVVAEDMRCRQCRGKCKADDLRCRSQCVGESTCLAQCDERSSKCEAMCKQIFQCE